MVIDPNMVVPTELNKPDIKFYDVREAPFGVYGVYYEDGMFRRLPEAVAETVNPGVLRLHANAAGGRVRFRTDSPYIAVSVRLGKVNLYGHMSTLGSAGMDLYLESQKRCIKSYRPPRDVSGHYESVIDISLQGVQDYTIDLPTYAEVISLHIGLAEGAQLLPPKPFPCDKKVVFYGSSITQGACASRPGNIYENMVARRLGFDYLNLGFSGNARGEDEIAHYIAGLPMDVFVYDYDHNAPDVEHLAKTHEKMFKIIRQAHPDIPIILMSRPKYRRIENNVRRMNVIRATYENARAAGDKKVWMLTGPQLMALCGEDGLVDGCHPNDLGFASMAKVLGDLMESEGILT